MKLQVLVPSEEYKSYAGARIRYGRLARELEKLGVQLSLEDIAAFDPRKDGFDALLISKCHDSRSLVAAAAARQRGRLVGVDLFDDYFSQASDSRLTRFRTWLAQLLPLCDFALCSTSSMAEVVQQYRAGLPVHVANDPGIHVSTTELSELLRSKVRKARNGQLLRLAWFGVGDNPYFRVGLSDLAAFSSMLRPIAAAGFEARLSVLTNARSLTTEGLALLAALPITSEIEEWTEAREQALLADTFACFLPVNAQRFSAAKSLNRAVTALSAGCQVISAGYPLYDQLGRFIYRDTAALLEDLAKNSLRHSAAHIEEYEQLMDRLASPQREASGIAQFLGKLEPSPATDVPLILVHGQSTNGSAHKAVQALKGLSVASPYCAAPMGFDVMFRGEPDRLTMLVSDGAASRLNRQVREMAATSTTIGDKKFWVVPDSSDGDVAARPGPWHGAPLPFQIGTYGPVMARIAERLERSFGPCRVLISESSQLPFSPNPGLA